MLNPLAKLALLLLACLALSALLVALPRLMVGMPAYRAQPSGGKFFGRAVISSCRADLDGDGKRELLTVLGPRPGGKGDEVIVAALKNGQPQPVLRARMQRLHPWKIRAADLDGDGRREVAIGVWKKSRFDPVFDNRLFIYDWDGTDLFPKWLGSRLSRRFVDFDFADVAGDRAEELLALETMPRGKRRLTVYEWTGFGFQGLWELKGNAGA